MFLDAIVEGGVEVGIAKKFGKEEYAMNFGGCTGISFSDFGRNPTPSIYSYILQYLNMMILKKHFWNRCFSFLGASADLVLSFLKDLNANIDDTDFVASVAINTPFANVGFSTGVGFNNEGQKTGHTFNLGYGVSVPLTGFPVGDVSFGVCKAKEIKQVSNYLNQNLG